MTKQEIICDFENGIIYRLKRNGEIKEIGIKRKDGYLQFSLEGKMVLNHRYLYENYYNVKLTREQQINHKNHARNDNRIENLEIVSCQENQQYQQIRKNNTSGYKGVCFDKNANKWRAQIRLNNKKKHLGLFNTPQEASNAYIKKATELNNQGHKYFIPDYS